VVVAAALEIVVVLVLVKSWIETLEEILKELQVVASAVAAVASVVVADAAVAYTHMDSDLENVPDNQSIVSVEVAVVSEEIVDNIHDVVTIVAAAADAVGNVEGVGEELDW